MIEQLLDELGIKCFVLTNNECPTCNEWIKTSYDKLVADFPHIKFHLVDCYEEHQSGRMYFPPLVVPSFYFYKDKTDFPLINQGLLPDVELRHSINRVVKLLDN